MKIIDFFNFFYKKYTNIKEINVLNCIKFLYFIHINELHKKMFLVFDGFYFEKILNNLPKKSKNFIFLFHENADSKIIELIEKNEKNSFEVISSDNEIIKFAKKKNNRTIKSEEFWTTIEKKIFFNKDEKKIKKNSSLKKTCIKENSNEEIDELMNKYS